MEENNVASSCYWNQVAKDMADKKQIKDTI